MDDHSQSTVEIPTDIDQMIVPADDTNQPNHSIKLRKAWSIIVISYLIAMIIMLSVYIGYDVNTSCNNFAKKWVITQNILNIMMLIHEIIYFCIILHPTNLKIFKRIIIASNIFLLILQFVWWLTGISNWGNTLNNPCDSIYCAKGMTVQLSILCVLIGLSVIFSILFCILVCILYRIHPSSHLSQVGATLDQISLLKKYIYQDVVDKISQDDAKCGICLDEYESNDTLRELPCKHHYHSGCVDEWLKRNKICPLCRQEIDKKTDEKSSISSEVQV